VARSRRALGSVGITLEGGRSVYWRHTPFENVRYFARLRGADPSSVSIDELLEGLQVPNPRSQSVGELSTGNKQKVAVACALVHDPALLVLDEPTLGLDVDAVAHIRRLVAAHVERRQGAFVITSHDLGFVADVCERVIVLHHGSVRYDGRLSVLRKDADGYRVRVVLDETAAKERVDERWADRVRAEVTRAGGTTTLSFQASGTADVFHAFDHLKAAHPAAILDVDVSKASLEAAYVRLSSGALS
jgi:ABC-2 type transport system ATP-binding protein